MFWLFFVYICMLILLFFKCILSCSNNKRGFETCTNTLKKRTSGNNEKWILRESQEKNKEKEIMKQIAGENGYEGKVVEEFEKIERKIKKNEKGKR